MIKNYIKIAWRNIISNRSFSLINIGGLSIGLAACLLLFIVIRYELSYNSFFPEQKNVYQIVTKSIDASGEDYTPGVPYPALEAFRSDMPDAQIAPLVINWGIQMSLPDNQGKIHPDKKFMDNIYFADPTLFSILQFTWLSGSPEILNQPNTVVITKSIAEKYFANWENALQQPIKIGNQLTATIGGILEDAPVNSDFPLTLIVSYTTFKNNPQWFEYNEEWGNNSSNNHIFIKTQDNLPVKELSRQLNAISTPFYKEMDPDEKVEHLLLPLKDIHYDLRFDTFGGDTISKNTLTVLSLIGIFILVMASINFINLSTAQAVNRSKEIGIRKVLGSRKRTIFWQLMSETALLILISMAIAILIIKPLLPYIENLTGITAPLSLFTEENFLFLGVTGVLLTFIAGCYPAIIIAGFRPATALKGKQGITGKAGIRKGLVVLQFVISQILIIGTLITILQMDMIRKSDLGFNKDAILVLKMQTDSIARPRMESFKNAIQQINGVQQISFNSDVPSSNNNSSSNFAFNHQPDEKFALFNKSADEYYYSTFELKFAAGKPYTAKDTSKSVVVNETLVKMLGINDPADIIGKDIRIGSGRWLPVSGVVKDFKTNSLRENIKPLLLRAFPEGYYNMAIKLNSNNLATTRKQIKDKWDEFYPEYVGRDYWVEESIARFYRQEEQLTLLYKVFAGIAVFISCLGLYGLISFSTIQKRKEVGIRKVLGASVANIILLFTKEIIMLIVIALLLAIPLAWWIANEWLSNFVYKISISWIIFLAAAATSVIIAWGTIIIRSYKAATANPVRNLRNE